jgi:hypothetical protein
MTLLRTKAYDFSFFAAVLASPVVVDGIAFLITTAGDNPASVKADTLFTYLCSTATRNVSSALVVTTTVTLGTTTPSSYILSDNVVDAAGNATAVGTRSVNVTVLMDNISQPTIGGLFHQTSTQSSVSNYLGCSRIYVSRQPNKALDV